MSIVVFVGPTLSRQEVERLLPAEVRPPAARGDLLRAARSRPQAIALIDGRFDGVPAVWHKEILWAMAEGIHVLGAASMGALRAAELSAYGMEGIGAVFESYRDGHLVADDEVAIAHATEEHGFRALSDALVNIRATLTRAIREKVLSVASAAAVLLHAQRTPYPDRSFSSLLAFAEASGLPADEVPVFRNWLPAGRVDQKRADALALLETLVSRTASGWPTKRTTYAFAHTDAWEALWRETTVSSRRIASTALVDELATQADFEVIHRGAMGRALALDVARRSALKVSAGGIREMADEFRRERGLLSAEQFAAWLVENEVDDRDVDAFFTREATTQRVQAEFHVDILPHMIDQLRVTSSFARLNAVAASRGSDSSPSSLVGPVDTATDEVLWQWYFIEHLRLGSVPKDLEAFAASRFTTTTRLRERALGEIRKRRSLEGVNGAAEPPRTID